MAFMAIFARHAAVAMTASWNEAGLNTALDTRKLIGQAQGLLMERHGLDGDRAFEVLRRYSQDHNIKLRDVAAHLIETRRLPTITTNLQLHNEEKVRLAPHFRQVSREVAPGRALPVGALVPSNQGECVWPADALPSLPTEAAWTGGPDVPGRSCITQQRGSDS